jgi:hypothetical protein
MMGIGNGDWLTRERVTRIAAISALAGLAMIAFTWLARHGTVDALGRPVGTDYTAFWAAGRLAIEGRPALAWDPLSLNAYVSAAHGVAYPTAWMYPPIFLLIIAPLAALPYLPGLFVWQLGSLSGVACALRPVLRDRHAIFIALASPLSAMTLGNGQNAFLTAGLLCAGLALLERRPFVAGMLLAGLSFKPQLALVIVPLLLFTGNWRAVIAATGTIVALCGLSLLLWGTESWLAFIHASGVARFLLETGDYGLHKSASLFSMMRQWGAPLSLSYAVQACGALAAILLIWRLRRAPLYLLYATVCGGVALTTPYLMDYDMASVGVGAVFFYAFVRDAEPLPYERSALAFIWAAPWFSRPAAEFLALPLGPIATVLLLALVVRRAWGAVPLTASPSRHSHAVFAR